MDLKELIKSLTACGDNRIELDFPVKGISCDSRKTGKDFVFVAIKGVNSDGNNYIEEALDKGARCVVLGPQGQDLPVIASGKAAVIRVRDDRKALAELACAFYGNPSANIKVTGVTGTNGKTTVTYLIEAILKECGAVPGVIGTVNCRFRDKLMAVQNTTPGPLELQSMLYQMQEAGVTTAVIEVSSHALEQARTEKINFSSAIFTNLTQDHLDYHKNMEDYFLAKSKLFLGLSSRAFAIVNNDDLSGVRLKKLSPCKLVSYGIDGDCDIRATGLKLGVCSSEFLIQAANVRQYLKTKLIGRHNVYNVLAAFAWAQAEGLDIDKVKDALGAFELVPGRLEKIESEKDFSVFVDYAHTEDALKNVLGALRQVSQGRIIVVFGCGGDRDRTKRPKMGNAATELADYAIITSDNPRSEVPEEIFRDIESGISRDNYRVVPDRLKAISESLSLARKGDIVLVAGKGHENYQVLKDKTLHFDDREAVRQCLRSMS
jgi:UDP-N-acetylmuramoyl-L-alanyl-D-glutamate--2,6-diaminopimelate ligase